MSPVKGDLVCALLSAGATRCMRYLYHVLSVPGGTSASWIFFEMESKHERVGILLQSGNSDLLRLEEDQEVGEPRKLLCMFSYILLSMVLEGVGTCVQGSISEENGQEKAKGTS